MASSTPPVDCAIMNLRALRQVHCLFIMSKANHGQCSTTSFTLEGHCNVGDLAQWDLERWNSMISFILKRVLGSAQALSFDRTRLDCPHFVNQQVAIYPSLMCCYAVTVSLTVVARVPPFRDVCSRWAKLQVYHPFTDDSLDYPSLQASSFQRPLLTVIELIHLCLGLSHNQRYGSN